MVQVCLLGDRAVFEIGGGEAKSFLQNLLTNNLDLVSPTRTIYTSLLTPQGKFQFDFFLIEKDGRYLVDCDAHAAPQLLKRLMFYKLRADVTLKDLSETWVVGAAWGDDEQTETGRAAPCQGGIRFSDPRLAALGTRFLVPADDADKALTAFSGEPAKEADYDLHRLTLGVPGREDLISEKSFPMEANLDFLHAIDFHKGCFVGQEVTSRTYRQGKVRKRILPISSSDALPAPGSPVMAGERQAGEVLSSRGHAGLALLRLDRLDEPLDANGTDIEARFPDWLPRGEENEESA